MESGLCDAQASAACSDSEFGMHGDMTNVFQTQLMCSKVKDVRMWAAGTEMYSTPIDMWSLGCIMAELLTKETLFVGESKNGSEIAQIKKIFDIVGTPSEDNWPGHKQLKNMDKVRLPTSALCIWHDAFQLQ